MIPAVVAAMALAAAEGPAAVRAADLLVLVPSPRHGLPKLRAALETLGQRAPSMRPLAWGREIGDPFGVDGLSVEELESAGVDVDRPLTAFTAAGAQIGCVATKKGVDLRPRLDTWLARRGARGKPAVDRSTVARSAQGAVVAGYLVKSGRACVYAGGGDGAAAMKVAGEALSRPGSPPAFARTMAGLEGVVQVFARDGPLGVAIAATSTNVRLDARLGRTVLAAVGGESEVHVRQHGLLEAAFHLSPKFLADPRSPIRAGVYGLLSAACGSCDLKAVAVLAERVAERMEGSVRIAVTGARLPAGRLDTAAAQFQVARFGIVAAVSGDMGDSETLMKEFADLAGGRPADTGVPHQGVGFEADAGPGKVWFGYRGGEVFLGNDPPALASIAGQPIEAAPCPVVGAAVACVSLPVLGRDLARVSLLDIGRTPALAAVFALALEFGSVLRGSGPLWFAAQPEGAATRVHADWTLPPPAPTP